MYSNLKDLIPDTREYENISESRDSDFQTLDQALQIVEKYIKDKSRILYGGMSIDFALKAAGKPGIYSDSTIPDYDFMSPTMYEDSIEIADIFMKQQFPNISSINAMHVTSRRVRINYVPVADITYVPDVVFKKVPTLEFNGLRIVHPDFQRLDMHRALSNPFELAPNEVIAFRTNKDICRFKLLDNAYPINLKDCQKFTVSTPVSIAWGCWDSAVMGDMAAYAFMHSALTAVCQQIGFDQKILNSTFDPGLDIKTGSVSFKSLENRCCVISEEHLLKLSKLNTKKTKCRYFNKLLDDIIPRRVEFEQDGVVYEIQDSKGKLLPAFTVMQFVKNIRTLAPHFAKFTPKNAENIYISGMQNVVLHFLARYWMFNDKKWLWLYWSGCELVKLAEQIYLKTSQRDFLQTPLFLTTKTYGTYNWDLSYIVRSRRLQTQIYDGRNAARKLSEIQPPFGYYPDKNEPAAEFNAANSWVFKMDGQETETPHTPLYLISDSLEASEASKGDNSENSETLKTGSSEFQDLISAVKDSFKTLSTATKAVKLFDETIKKEFNCFEKLDQIPEQIQYVIDFPAVRLGMHWGQRKLLLSEIQFLSKNPQKHVLYVGAAPGNKNHYLMKLFPEKKFIFVDPVRFNFQIDGKSHRSKPHDDLVHLSATSSTNANYYNFSTQQLEPWTPDNNNDLTNTSKKDILAYIKQSKFRGFLIENLFTEKLAKDFADLDDCLFISDIRSFFTLQDGKIITKTPTSSKNPQGDNASTITDITILWDMCLQFLWMMIMKPKQSMIKFRTMYYDPDSLNHYKLYTEKHKDTEYMRAAFEQAKQLGIDFIADYKKKTIIYPIGIEYLQAFAPVKSGETRLYISQENLELAETKKFKKYDHQHHDNTIFYHNIMFRPFAFCKNTASLAALGFDHCQDCALEHEIWQEYLATHDHDPIPENVHAKVREVSWILKGSLDRRGHGKFFVPISQLM